LFRFISVAFVGALLSLATLAHAQQLDLAAGDSAIWSSKDNTASVGFLPPPLKGGKYPTISAEYISDNHFGILVEGSFRYHYDYYDGFQQYRPVFYDINGVYTTRLARKTRGDFMAGIGGESLIFYNPAYACGNPTGGCRTFQNSTHFLMHAGVGVRYLVWRRIFVRPEAHYSYVPNNFQFHSNNIFRAGISVGYTFGESADIPPRPKKAK
jgi:hypothetical protein